MGWQIKCLHPLHSATIEIPSLLRTLVPIPSLTWLLPSPLLMQIAHVTPGCLSSLPLISVLSHPSHALVCKTLIGRSSSRIPLTRFAPVLLNIFLLLWAMLLPSLRQHLKEHIHPYVWNTSSSKHQSQLFIYLLLTHPLSFSLSSAFSGKPSLTQMTRWGLSALHFKALNIFHCSLAHSFKDLVQWNNGWCTVYSANICLMNKWINEWMENLKLQEKCCVNINTTPHFYSHSISFRCMHLCICICLVLCNFITCVYLCGHHHSQEAV